MCASIWYSPVSILVDQFDSNITFASPPLSTFFDVCVCECQVLFSLSFFLSFIYCHTNDSCTSDKHCSRVRIHLFCAANVGVVWLWWRRAACFSFFFFLVLIEYNVDTAGIGCANNATNSKSAPRSEFIPICYGFQSAHTLIQCIFNRAMKQTKKDKSFSVLSFVRSSMKL